MDSFYDQPRTAPVPLSADGIPAPYVPEVSMIFQNSKTSQGNQRTIPTPNEYLPYNVWKTKNKCESNKENYSDSQTHAVPPSHISRKQVRFERPVLQRPAPPIQFVDGMNRPNRYFHNRMVPSGDLPKPFEEIYMANIPNRNLDLSVIELRKPVQCNNDYRGKEVVGCKSPVIFKNASTMNNSPRRRINDADSKMNESKGCGDNRIASQHIDYTDARRKNEIDVYKAPTRDPPFINRNEQLYNNDTFNSHLRNSYQANASTKYNDFVEKHAQTERKIEDDEPTVKDLLKVIQQQNEQLMLLQKQVAVLLENKCKQKQIEAPPADVPPNYPCVMSTQIEPVNVFNKNAQDNAKAMPKFAIDVMTSFEVSIRPPVNYPHRNKFHKDVNHELKIQELTETESNVVEKDNPRDDVSLAFNESLNVQERCQSPEQSIHVDMQDYSSDSDEESSESVGSLGWTIYNNVMGQVNNILNAQGTNASPGANPGYSADKLRNKTMKKVQEATMRHLKTIGVNIPPVDPDKSIKSNVTTETEYSPTEISFAVKQLLMKYLPDEQLAKVMCKQSSDAPVQDCKTSSLIKRRPEFSFATVEYMKKYNLISDARQVKPVVQDSAAGVTHDAEMPKILDITALKQQAKLL